MCTDAHDCSQHLNHKQHKDPDHIRALIGTEPFRGEEALFREHKNIILKNIYIILKVVIVKDLEK